MQKAVSLAAEHVLEITKNLKKQNCEIRYTRTFVAERNILGKRESYENKIGHFNGLHPSISFSFETGNFISRQSVFIEIQYTQEKEQGNGN